MIVWFLCLSFFCNLLVIKFGWQSCLRWIRGLRRLREHWAGHSSTWVSWWLLRKFWTILYQNIVIKRAIFKGRLNNMDRGFNLSGSRKTIFSSIILGLLLSHLNYVNTLNATSDHILNSIYSVNRVLHMFAWYLIRSLTNLRLFSIWNTGLLWTLQWFIFLVSIFSCATLRH